MASGYVRQSVRKIARGPVSRVLSGASLRLCGHSSRRRVAPPLKQPTRATSRNKLICRPYSVLHPVGFSVPETLPPPRCALAAPFRPYPPKGRRYAFCGTFPRRRTPGRALPGTVVPWSPDFPRPRIKSEAAAARPSGPLHMGYCGLGSNRDSNFARHSPSTTPSIRSGRKRRWKAITAFCWSVTS